MHDPDSLIAALRKTGATVDPKEQIEESFLSVKGTQLAVNGIDVQVFEYPDEFALRADAIKVADLLAGRGTMILDWGASPHAYRTGRMIILYLGDDATMLHLLRSLLGAPFAEQPLPLSQTPTAQPTRVAGASHSIGQATDLASFIRALQAKGLKVKATSNPERPPLPGKATLLTVSAAELEVFEYADAQAVQAAMAMINPDGSLINVDIDWDAPPHFYQAGRIIVLYVGDDRTITKVLTRTLGPQIAGWQ